MVSSCIHFIVKYSIHFCNWAVCHHVLYPIFLTQASVDGYLCWFHVLAIVNWTAINIRIETILLYADFISFGCVPMNGTIHLFQISNGLLCCLLVVMLVHISTNRAFGYFLPHIFTSLFLKHVWMTAILTGAIWNPTVVFNCFSLMVSDP